MAKNKSKSAATQKPAAPAKAASSAKAQPAPLPVTEVKRTPDATEKPSKKTALRESILARKAAIKPIAFSLDEVRAIAKTNASKAVEVAAKPVKGAAKGTQTKPTAAKSNAVKVPAILEKPAKPNHVKAASLADILGFNPKKAKSVEIVEESTIPEKFRRYYRILVDMRAQLTEGIERHSEESLKRSAKDDAGDLSAYGQNMADGGINTFDRDFVLSLVSSEQEALSEIDAAIKRIHDGTYGICEVTGKAIAKERLLAVPFTRCSTEAQKQIEKNRYRSRAQSDLFGEMSEEGGKLIEDDSGGEE
jgi:RNA polymerase-binding transcription factor DksA